MPRTAFQGWAWRADFRFWRLETELSGQRCTDFNFSATPGSTPPNSANRFAVKGTASARPSLKHTHADNWRKVVPGTVSVFQCRGDVGLAFSEIVPDLVGIICGPGCLPESRCCAALVEFATSRSILCGRPACKTPKFLYCKSWTNRACLPQKAVNCKTSPASVATPARPRHRSRPSRKTQRADLSYSPSRLCYGTAECEV